MRVECGVIHFLQVMHVVHQASIINIKLQLDNAITSDHQRPPKNKRPEPGDENEDDVKPENSYGFWRIAHQRMSFHEYCYIKKFFDEPVRPLGRIPCLEEPRQSQRRD